MRGQLRQRFLQASDGPAQHFSAPPPPDGASQTIGADENHPFQHVTLTVQESAKLVQIELARRDQQDASARAVDSRHGRQPFAPPEHLMRLFTGDDQPLGPHIGQEADAHQPCRRAHELCLGHMAAGD